MDKHKKTKKKSTAAAATKVAKAVVNAITHSSPAQKQKKKRNRKHKTNSFLSLSNHQGGSGRLGLSSANRSSTRLRQVIEEDEYIADINGSVAFATTPYNVNIGQGAVFPWGSKIAALFEKYHFDKLEFYYRREVSEYATNGQSGKVMLSFDYDSSDAAPTSKQQVLDTVPHADAMPCKPSINLNINTNEMKAQDGWYVRTGAQPANTDIKTYDAGILYVSTYGCANTTAIGELRVRYKCTLMVPILQAPGGPALQAGSYAEITSALVGETSAASGTWNAQFVSTTNPVVIANGIQATLGTTGLITLLPGVYKIEMSGASYSNGASISAMNYKLCQVTTANTDPVIAGITNGAVSQVNEATAAYNGWFSPLSGYIWSTAQWGLTLSLQASTTYGAGTAVNNSYIKITSL
jgi:hypothetical protein